MLRRVSQFLRNGLLAAGVLLILWLPASFFVGIFVSSPISRGGIQFESLAGYTRMTWFQLSGLQSFHATILTTRSVQEISFLHPWAAIAPQLDILGPQPMGAIVALPL